MMTEVIHQQYIRLQNLYLRLFRKNLISLINYYKKLALLVLVEGPPGNRWEQDN